MIYPLGGGDGVSTTLFSALFNVSAFRDACGAGESLAMVMKRPAAATSTRSLKRPAVSGSATQNLRDSILGENMKQLTDGMRAKSNSGVVKARANLKEICVLGVCSLCSGTNMFAMVCFGACIMLGAGRVQDMFHSESKPSKALFGQHLASLVSVDHKATHVFPDMTKLSAATSVCTAHPRDENGEKKECVVPGPGADSRPLLSSVGFCCTNYSKLFQGAGPKIVSLQQPDRSQWRTLIFNLG